MDNISSSRLFVFQLAALILFIFASQSDGAFECPMFPGCLCDNSTEQSDLSVDCSSRGLSSVPVPNSSYSGTIIELKLNNNNINSLGENILPNMNIVKLDLSDNPISSVHDNCFANLRTVLKKLILNGNSSSVPPKNAFKYLNVLEELTLKNYQVTHLEQTDSFFISFNRLKNLTLDTWQLKSVEPGSFQMSSGNFLTSLSILNQPSENLPIRAFEANDLSRLKNVRISFTYVTVITFHSFVGVDNIDLSNNHIHTLEKDCFQRVESNLVRLSLFNNSLTSDITKFPGLANLVNLQELDLSKNEMTSVPDLAQLGSSGQPLRLSLSRNKISSLGEKSFTGISERLRVLNLSDNELTTIHADSFDGVTKLEVLYLSRSSPNTRLILPSSLTSSARTFKELYVDGQDVDFLEMWQIVQQLPQLEVLNVSYTKLAAIPNNAFFNLVNLKTLDLSNNKLNTLTQASLAGPRSLKFLSLAGNSIKQLSSCTFYQYTNYPIILAMKNNLLTCDCNIRWLWNHIKNGTVTFPQGQEAMCSDGQLLTSKNIEEICNSQFTEPECFDLYSISLTISLEKKDDSVLVSWQLTKKLNFKYYTLKVENANRHQTFLEINSASESYTVNDLASNSSYIICVTAYFNTFPSISNCSTISGFIDQTGNQNGKNNNETAIIIGVVVGGVVLLAIIAVIIYLVFFYRKRKEKAPSNVPVQPRNFSKAELPAMNEDTRTFSKPKRPRENGVSEHRDGMQVVAVSDGQISNPRVGRAQMLNSDGSYKSSSKPSSTSSYDNDRGPLPPIPRSKSANKPDGYYNMGFRDDKYDEINHGGKESMI